ncbi:DUF6455 family protein [Pseudoponticoccus marisrubri]|uniref:DUF6455 domain-containing protein n=1 Tax=Pseudoponticoccus marisrubri TaxID=1685382 RepID=A0A0W7WI80_9RHOB|nr:DUF6455 family protein [Pseudoponticoccus marisrubri]KUF10215.1 hypothetical protein AVJ23_14330 [Pseudoponticoccus marisrubri]
MSERLGDPAHHFFLTRSVARVMGLSLSEAMNRGQLAPATYADMVTGCRACPLVEACQHWLAARTDLSASAPPGCCNGETLQRLARALH